MKIIDMNDEPEEVQRINRKLAEIAALSGNQVSLHIGIGKRGGGPEGMVSLECKVLGINERAAHVGAKLISLVAPIIDNFLKHEFTEWAKNQKDGDWMDAYEGKGTVIRVSGEEEGPRKKRKFQMSDIPDDKARA